MKRFNINRQENRIHSAVCVDQGERHFGYLKLLVFVFVIFLVACKGQQPGDNAQKVSEGAATSSAITDSPTAAPEQSKPEIVSTTPTPIQPAAVRESGERENETDNLYDPAVHDAYSITADDGEFFVVVYNVENLFDADGVALFQDYTSEKYRPKHVLRKLQNITRVMQVFQDGQGPEIILFQEFEADRTPSELPHNYADILERYSNTTIEEMLTEPLSPDVSDLPAEALLLKAFRDAGLGDYNVVVGEYRADPLGRVVAHVNVTFSRFPIIETLTHQSEGARGTLEIVHEIDGHRLHTFNSHWKSGASNADDEQLRLGNAKVMRKRLEEILANDPSADVVLGGDFNSQYNQYRRLAGVRKTAVNGVLGSQGDEFAIREEAEPHLYNLWYEFPPERRGSDVYRGEWGTLMQMMITRGLYDYQGVQYVDNSFDVAILEGLNAQRGSQIPIRWNFFNGDGAGFSDHFPIYSRFRVSNEDDSQAFVDLESPGTEATTSTAARTVDYTQVKSIPLPRLRDLGSDNAIRSSENLGHVFRIEATVTGERPFRVTVFNEEYNVWAFDIDLRRKIYERYVVGDPLVIVGEVGIHEGNWQFVVRDISWLDR